MRCSQTVRVECLVPCTFVGYFVYSCLQPIATVYSFYYTLTGIYNLQLFTNNVQQFNYYSLLCNSMLGEMHSFPNLH